MELAFFLYFLLFTSLIFWYYLDQIVRDRYGRLVCEIIKPYPVMIFILIVGFRYNVGGDFPAYVSYYNDQYFISDSSEVDYEYGFYILIEILHFIDLPSQSIFVVCSFFQIILLLKVIQLSKESGFLLIFFYFTTLSFVESLNVMRQSISFLGVILSVYYISNRYYKYAFVNMIIAVMFHNSSLLAIPIIYLLSKFKLYRFTSVFIILIMISHYFAIEIFSIFIDIISSLNFVGGYSGYLVMSKELFIKNINNGISIGLILSIFTDIYLVTRGKQFIDFSDKSIISIVFNSYLIGCILYPIVAATGFLALGRGMMYFYGMKFIVMGVVLYRGFKNGNSLEQYGFLIVPVVIMYFVWFCVAVSIGAAGSSPYHSYFYYIL